MADPNQELTDKLHFERQYHAFMRELHTHLDLFYAERGSGRIPKIVRCGDGVYEWVRQGFVGYSQKPFDPGMTITLTSETCSSSWTPICRPMPGCWTISFPGGCGNGETDE